jgi:hypothetical protein
MLTAVGVYLTLSLICCILVAALLKGAGRDCALDLATLEQAVRGELSAAQLPTPRRELAAEAIAPPERRHRAGKSLRKRKCGVVEAKPQHGAA